MIYRSMNSIRFSLVCLRICLVKSLFCINIYHRFHMYRVFLLYVSVCVWFKLLFLVNDLLHPSKVHGKFLRMLFAADCVITIANSGCVTGETDCAVANEDTFSLISSKLSSSVSELLSSISVSESLLLLLQNCLLI